MLQKISTALFLSFLIFSCSQENQPFTPVNENFETTDLILPKEYSYSVLFQEEYDSVVTKEGKAFPAKGSHDLTVFIPDSTHPTTKGIIYISHESKLANSNLGDGGGATVFDIELINDHWEITSKFQDVDFSTVGGTYLNCGGSLSPNNTILTCEEADYTNNKRFYKDGKGLTDTSNIFDKPLWQNFGYVVEVDPNSKKALRKLKHMGRFVHEDAHCTKDGKTVYLSDDFCPAVFFKFVADTPFDYSTGQLYAFKQENQHEKGNWIKLPMDDSSLVYARDNAIALGATMFIRHEWIEAIDNKLYITETGTDSFNWNKHIAAGGTVPWYIKNNLQQDDSYSDK